MTALDLFAAILSNERINYANGSADNEAKQRSLGPARSH